jgi:hypothetical protein
MNVGWLLTTNVGWLLTRKQSTIHESCNPQFLGSLKQFCDLDPDPKGSQIFWIDPETGTVFQIHRTVINKI